MMTNSLSRVGVKCVALVLVTAGAVSCGLDKQSAPELAGPSEFGLSLTLRALPDTIVADGESQSAIQVTARGPNGNPLAGVTVALQAFVDSAVGPVRLTQETIVTDANGVATTGLVAPPAPATQFASEPVVTVTAVPVSTDFANGAARTVQVRLRAPEGTPPGSQTPRAVIVASPPVANMNETIRFDASLSTDEGLACGSRCRYLWEFPGNVDPVWAVTTERAFSVPGSYTVTLTVTDETGGVGTASVTVRVVGPAAPQAAFTSSPSSPRVGAEVMFDGSNSTVGSGASITRYNWDFGDGTTDSKDTPRSAKFYAAAGTYDVTLRVTDSFGRESSVTSTITVVP